MKDKFEIIVAIHVLHCAKDYNSLLVFFDNVRKLLSNNGKFIAIVGHMDKYSKLNEHQINEIYSKIGFQVQYDSYPPHFWSPVSYKIFNDKSEIILSLTCPYVPIDTYKTISNNFGFSFKLLDLSLESPDIAFILT